MMAELYKLLNDSNGELTPNQVSYMTGVLKTILVLYKEVNQGSDEIVKKKFRVSDIFTNPR
jgi:hypothetical protein